MIVIESSKDVQALSDEWKREKMAVGLVPTMGALHRGHLELCAAAAEACDRVVVTIFVNPTQFAPGEDFERYPRNLEKDVAMLEASGHVAAVFAPPVEEMYPEIPNLTSVYVDRLGDNLCGAFRPGHFEGVATIVTRLLNIGRPTRAFFGLKDIQQFVIINKLVDDLNMGIEIVGVPTVREEDGLALSSRNIYLSPDEREQAVVLSQAVKRAADLIEEGERDTGILESEMLSILKSAPLGKVQYAEVVDGRMLQRVEKLTPGEPVVAATAVYFGGTRLIDNAYIIRMPA